MEAEEDFMAKPIMPDEKSRINNMQKDQKTREIIDACERRQLSRLRMLATSNGGLISDQVRRIAWPILLGYTKQNDNGNAADSWKSLPEHKDEYQVSLDVNRSFIYYPNNQSTQQLDKRKVELSDLIIAVLRNNPYLSYFQGYHDICQVFLLVFGQTGTSIPSLTLLSTLRIRDFMLPTLSPAVAQLVLIPALLDRISPALCRHLSETLQQPFFALPGTLTMYAHDIQEYSDISRLFDVLIARESVFSIYLFVQIILLRSKELMETPIDEQDIMHSILSKLPKPLDLEALIANAAKLFDKHPPETLYGWRTISKYSVLKTSRWPDDMVKQTAEDGAEYFQQHVAEIEWEKRKEAFKKRVFQKIWKYRRPATAVGIALLAGAMAIWLRETPLSSSSTMAFWRQFITGEK